MTRMQLVDLGEARVGEKCALARPSHCDVRFTAFVEGNRPFRNRRWQTDHIRAWRSSSPGQICGRYSRPTVNQNEVGISRYVNIATGPVTCVSD